MDEDLGLADLPSSANNNGMPIALGVGVASGSGTTENEGIVKFFIVYLNSNILNWVALWVFAFRMPIFSPGHFAESLLGANADPEQHQSAVEDNQHEGIYV